MTKVVQQLKLSKFRSVLNPSAEMKFKHESETLTKNFLEILPEEISEFIFMKLLTCDLLNATLVHRSWNSFIGSSRKLMKIIKLRLSSRTIKPSSPDHVVEILSESIRMYEHLELNIFGTVNISLIAIIEIREWKSFQLNGKINQIDVHRLMEKLTTNCANLESLEIQIDWLNETKKLLRKSKNLKNLKLRGRLDDEDIFDRLEMKLEKLELITWREYNRPPYENPQVFNNFLKSQSDTLKALSIDFGSYGPYIDHITLRSILDMNQLTDLKINIESDFLPSHQSVHHLPDNFSITKLHLILNFNNLLKWGINQQTKSFMNKFRSLKTLQMKELHRKIFEYISDFKTLEEIIIDELIYISSDNSRPTDFPNLQKIKFCHAVHPKLQRHLENTSENQVGNFSRCLLKELVDHPNNESKFRSTAIYPSFVLDSA